MKLSEMIDAMKMSISRIRRNHALEHATLHVLAQSHPHVRLVGHSDAEGLHIMGDVCIRDLHAALEEAQQRLKAGEHHLAVHPYCGTNLVVGGGLAALAGAIAIRKARAKNLWEWLDQWALVVLLGVLALWVAQPLGAKLQEQVTTEPHLQGLKISSIISREHPLFGKWHRVITQG